MDQYEDATSKSSDVKDLLDNTSALGEFSKCLDPQLKFLQNWEHFAYTLGVPPDVICTCKIYLQHSPTIEVFEYLEATKPDMPIHELRAALTRNRRRARPDIKAMLEGFGDNEKVSEVITKASSDILDKIALKLDSAESPTCNWKDFSLEVGITRDKLQKFEMYTSYNPTEALFRCLYTTSSKIVKLSVIVGYLEQMKREDILKEIKSRSQSEDIGTTNAKDILKLGSALLDETSKRLNKDIPGVEDWQGLARHLLSDKYIDDEDIISKLEPPRHKQIHSPTKKVVEWLSVNESKTELVDIIEACKKIKRPDAVKVLIKYFSRAHKYAISDQPDSPPTSLGYSVQETSDTGNILNRNRRRFGLPESTVECMLRVQKRNELVSYLSSGQQKLVVLHSATGCGKTSLVLSVADELIQKHNYTCVYVNSKGIFNIEDLSVKILTTCGIPAPNTGGSTRVKELFKNLNQKCVLILDNFDHMFHANDNDLDRSINSPGMCSDASTAFPRSQSLPTGYSCTPRKSTEISASFQEMHNSSLEEGDKKSPGRKQSESLLWGKNISEKDEYQNFLIEIIQSVPATAPNVAILATSWESFTSTKVNSKAEKLPPLHTDESKELFLHKCKSVLGIEASSISDDLADNIVKRCSGIPLLLCCAVTFIEGFGSFDDGANQLVISLPEEVSSKLSLDDLPCEERFNYCLDVCFGRLDELSQTVLINVSVFPGPFTVQAAEAVSKETLLNIEKLEQALSELRRFNFISCVGENTSFYMSSAIRSFVIHIAAATEPRNDIYQDALCKFVNYVFQIISEVEKDFFSSNCGDVIQRYRDQEENLREIGRWCISERCKVPTSVKETIINSFAEFYWINLKLMKTHLLKFIIGGFVQHCKLRYSKYYIESLIFGGATFVRGCHCRPHLCAFAHRKAMTCFDKAVKAISDESPTTNTFRKWMPKLVFRRRETTTCYELETIDQCTIISAEAKTEMLIKYGKCLVRNGLDEGLALIQTGIDRRKEILRKTSSTKNHIMVALGYKDLACAYSYLRRPVKSIEIHESMVIPVYKQYLGIRHPFTSSALSQLAHAYHALESYGKAIQMFHTVLNNRRELLGEHHETASSLFDMGHIKCEQASICDDPDAKEQLYKDALEYLLECVQMREKLAYTPKETAETHNEICGVLERLGRSDEAEEHREKIYQQMKKIDNDNDRLN